MSGPVLIGGNYGGSGDSGDDGGHKWDPVVEEPITGGNPCAYS
jgi:hypothetical protein